MENALANSIEAPNPPEDLVFHSPHNYYLKVFHQILYLGVVKEANDQKLVAIMIQHLLNHREREKWENDREFLDYSIPKNSCMYNITGLGFRHANHSCLLELSYCQELEYDSMKQQCFPGTRRRLNQAENPTDCFIQCYDHPEEASTIFIKP